MEKEVGLNAEDDGLERHRGGESRWLPAISSRGRGKGSLIMLKNDRSGEEHSVQDGARLKQRTGPMDPKIDVKTGFAFRGLGCKTSLVFRCNG